MPITALIKAEQSKHESLHRNPMEALRLDSRVVWALLTQAIKATAMRSITKMIFFFENASRSLDVKSG